MKPTRMLLCLAVSFAIVVLGVAGCSRSENSQDLQSVRAGSQAGRGSDGSIENACLLAYATRYDELLPLPLAAEITGLPAEQAKTSYSRMMANPAYQELQYSWPSDRIRTMSTPGIEMNIGGKVTTVGGGEVSVPRSHVMGLGGMGQGTLERFLLSHRPVTSRDREEVDRAIETSDAEALQSEQARSVATDLAGMMADITQAYREVHGVGEAAAYNTAQSMLYVHDRGVTFHVLADLSDDDHDANQTKAVVVARRVLGRCP